MLGQHWGSISVTFFISCRDEGSPPRRLTNPVLADLGSDSEVRRDRSKGRFRGGLRGQISDFRGPFWGPLRPLGSQVGGRPARWPKSPIFDPLQISLFPVHWRSKCQNVDFYDSGFCRKLFTFLSRKWSILVTFRLLPKRPHFTSKKPKYLLLFFKNSDPQVLGITVKSGSRFCVWVKSGPFFHFSKNSDFRKNGFFCDPEIGRNVPSWSWRFWPRHY